MQSNQSKLLITALVAAKAASALEITEGTALIENHQDEVKNFLAQVQDVEEGKEFTPPSNDNTDTSADEAAAMTDEKKQDDTDAIDSKIDLLTEAAIGGLNAKKDWII